MQQADEREFEQFVRLRSTALLRTAYLLTGDRGDAEDLLQVVLLRVAQHWTDVTGTKEGYVRRALTRAAIDRWRGTRVIESPVSDVPERASTLDESSIVDLRDELITALFALSARQRAVLVLRYFEDLPESEIAAALGCSAGAVKSYAARGLTRMREIASRAEHAQKPMMCTNRSAG